MDQGQETATDAVKTESAEQPKGGIPQVGAPQIYRALIRAKKSIGAIAKKGKLEDGKIQYDFRRFDDVLNASAPLLNEHGIIVVPRVVAKEERQNGKFHYVTVTVVHQFCAEDGSSVEATTVGEAFDFGDKAATKAQTVAYRIALVHILNIPYEEMQDNESGPQGAWGDASGTLHRLLKSLKECPDTAKLKKLFGYALKCLRGEGNGSDVLTPEQMAIARGEFIAAAERCRIREQDRRRMWSDIDKAIHEAKMPRQSVEHPDAQEEPVRESVNDTEPPEDWKPEPIEVDALRKQLKGAGSHEDSEKAVESIIQAYLCDQIAEDDFQGLCGDVQNDRLPEFFLHALSRADTPDVLAQTRQDLTAAYQQQRISGDTFQALCRLAQSKTGG